LRSRSLLRTLAAIKAPSSVKTRGSFVRPPRPGFDIAFCDINVSNSSRLTTKEKSAGNRSDFASLLQNQPTTA
jgi:hypothetical protein